MSHFNLLVDPLKRRLVDGITGLTVTGHISPSEALNISSVPLDSRYRHLLQRYANLTRPSPAYMSKYVGVEHHIETKGAPIRSKARRLPPEKYRAAKEEFLKMVEEGICRPSNSPWSSPLHVVYKKDGSLRPCGDYRLLNSKTTPDRYGVPNLLDFTNKLQGTQIYSTLDIRKAYHHIPIAQEDIVKTAIITPFGLFEFVKMTFDLRNAAQTFQRYMDQLLRDLTTLVCPKRTLLKVTQINLNDLPEEDTQSRINYNNTKYKKMCFT